VTIAEIQERLERKFRDDYRLVRQKVANCTDDDLSIMLADALTSSHWHPSPEGDTTTTWEYYWEYHGNEHDWADWYPDPEYTSDPETTRKEWYGHRVDKVTFCRAIRDELASRFDREFIHEQVGYDS
jgi:hypothetical protein